MFRSEKKSLYRFLSIYLLSTFILFAIGASIFYTLEKHHLIDKQRQMMTQEAEHLQHQLIALHKSFAKRLPIYIDPAYTLTLLDIDKSPIAGASTLLKQIDFTKEYQTVNSQLVYLKSIEPYYLGTAYIVLHTPINQVGITDLQRTILFFMLAAGLFFLLLGLFLGRLFIAPMREAIETMNRFIQDTTHELNTPVSTILTNLELIQTMRKCNAKEEMRRIEIASKTLSRIYDDLTYLKLNHTYHRNIRPLDLSRLLKERIAYFATAIEAKKLQLDEEIAEDVVLEMDHDDALRLIDNLLSNAIKYNRTGGKLRIELDPARLVVADSGVGMDAQTLQYVHERFRRANSSEGGFGIGLDIVHQVIKAYGFAITFNSEPNKGTEVTVRWEK